MKHWTIIPALALLALPAAGGVEVRTIERDVPIEDGQRLRLDIPVAEVEIEGGSGDEVSVTLVIECSRFSKRCESKAEDLRLESRSSGRSVTLSVEGYPKSTTGGPSIEASIRVPRDRAIEIDLGVGELEVHGMQNDLAIDVGVGDVEVEIAESSVRSVDLEVGVGDAEIDVDGGGVSESGFLFLGNEVRWNKGRGQAEVEVDVGVGAVEVVLAD